MQPFITVYECMIGWKAVCMSWNEELAFYEPEQTAYFAHPTKEDAVKEAKEWAASEDLEFKP